MAKLIVILIVLGLLFLCAGYILTRCDKPPVVTPTKVPTNTPTVTGTLPPTFTPVPFTKTPTPTGTISPTFTPTVYVTKTATPSVLVVHTGYENGWLHYRPGPSKSYIPEWLTGIGAVQENTKLGFLDCPDTFYSWVHVIFKGYSGYVYGDFLEYNPCYK